MPRLILALAPIAIGCAVAMIAGAPVNFVLIVAGTGIATLLLAMGAEDAGVRPRGEAGEADESAASHETPIEDHMGFRAIIDATPDSILIVRGGRVAAANPAARELLGDFIVGADVRTAIRHPAAAERLADPRPESARGASDLIGLGKLARRVEMRTVSLPDASRFVILTDRTAIDAAETSRADFVANASHELRTPLAAILGFVETLSDPETGADTATRERFLTVIDKEARRMQRLVDDLLSLSRIEASKFRAPAERIDIAALTARVVDEIANRQDRRAQDVVINADADLPQIRGDEAQMSQLLHNIVGNAMKYGRAGTPVAIRIARDGRAMIALSVRDEGDGIAPEHLPRLTERFYRVDSARSRSLGGTGLGLSLVKHIVERHRGRIDIASRIGHGSTVTIVLPAANADTIGGETEAVVASPATSSDIDPCASATPPS